MKYLGANKVLGGAQPPYFRLCLLASFRVSRPFVISLLYRTHFQNCRITCISSSNSAFVTPRSVYLRRVPEIPHIKGGRCFFHRVRCPRFTLHCVCIFLYISSVSDRIDWHKIFVRLFRRSCDVQRGDGRTVLMTRQRRVRQYKGTPEK